MSLQFKRSTVLALGAAGLLVCGAGTVAAGSTTDGGVPDRVDVRAATESDASTGSARAAMVAADGQREELGRGLIAVRTGAGTFVSWRLLLSDPPGTGFDLYRASNGQRVLVNDEPIRAGSNHLDVDAPADATYTVVPVDVGGRPADPETFGPAGAPESQTVETFATSFDIPLQQPPGGTTPDGEQYTYIANDASVGDLDGDGEYEIVLKWDPTNAHDNAHDGYTGNQIIDAYKLDGTRLWRIDLGRNIRSGAHYTQFQVYDYDGNGRAEVVMKTADATVDGTGGVIGDPGADYRNAQGRVLSGPEFLTVFDGPTGAALATADFVPARGDVCAWGDCYGNRVDRFLAGTAYVDGQGPSIIMARGYYTRTVVSAWDWRNGQLTRRWTFDSQSSTNGPEWEGQGNHQLSVADVDGDGRDEILYGAMAIDDNGSGLWVTGTGHGDAYHAGDLLPDRPGLEVYQISESGGSPSSLMLDARTGDVIWATPSCGCDNGRGVAGNIWSGSPGAEAWSSADSELRSSSGQGIGRKPSSTNFLIWWDGEPTRELLDDVRIDKYGPNGDTRLLTGEGVASNNGTKATPVLSADLLGDWREEVIWRTTDNRALRVYATTEPTDLAIPTLMQDRQYRLAIAWQNTAYNQPPHPSFFLDATAGDS